MRDALRGEPTSAAEKRYDLFVAYSDAERAWVRGYLLPAVGLLPERVLSKDEFRPGAPVVEEFERAVLTSRFTLVVFSGSFLADEWSLFGEQLATVASVTESRDHLIPLLREPCPVPLHARFRVALDCTDEARWDAEAARLRNLLSQPEPPPDRLSCPYPGMVPFGTGDMHRFHGREVEIAEVMRRVRHQHFLTVIGPSGSGKSSLVFAGILPELLRTRSDRWLVRSLRPGSAPSTALEQALGGGGTTMTTAARFTEGAEALMYSQPRAERLLLVIDQLEEAFVQAPAPDRLLFFTGLGALRQLDCCTLLLVVRADFYPDLMTCPLWPIAPGERVEVAPLRGNALRRAIERPATAIGVQIERALVERLVADAAQEPGALPLMQETMVLLWEQRRRRLVTLRAYEELGTAEQSGLAVALATKAEAVLNRLSPAERDIAKRIFLRLVQLGEGREDTRRQQSVGELQGGERDDHLFPTTLDRLTEERLLIRSGAEGDQTSTVDLAHEALISSWPTLRRWIEDNREHLRMHRRLAVDAQEWEALGRDPGALYRGARLALAVEWSERHPDEHGLQPLERAFLDASRDLAAREAQRELAQAQALAAEQERRAEQQQRHATVRGRLVVALSVLLLVTMAAGAAAFFQAHKVRRLSFASVTSVLVSRAEVQHEQGQHERAALMARQAYLFNERFELGMDRAVHAALSIALDSNPFGHEIDVASPVTAVAFGATGLVASGAGEGTVQLGPPGALTRTTLRAHAGPVLALAFSRDGHMLASGGADGAITVWDTDTGRRILGPLAAHLPRVLGLSFSPDGAVLASGGGDGMVALWDVGTGRTIERLAGHKGPVRGVAFAAEGALVSGGDDGALRAWDVAGHTSRLLLHQQSRILSVQANPRSTTIAWGTDDGRLGLYDLQTSNVSFLLTPAEHAGFVGTVAFSEDATALASGSGDNLVRHWDLSSSLSPQILRGHVDPVLAVALSPDGRWVASGGQRIRRHRGLAWIWDLRNPQPATGSTETLAGIVCQRVWRNLTPAEWAEAAPGVPFQQTCPGKAAGDGDTPG